jgi:hypothetical protein
MARAISTGKKRAGKKEEFARRERMNENCIARLKPEHDGLKK